MDILNLIINLIRLIIELIININNIQTPVNDNIVTLSPSSFSSIISSITTNSINNSTLAFQVTTEVKTCPEGFLGPSCEIECGVTFVDQNLKIVGGLNATQNSWPAQAYIRACLLQDCFSCGGTLIYPETVLTAAHCVGNLSYTYWIYLGLNDRSNIDQNNLPSSMLSIEIPFSNIIIHNEYDPDSLINDIALFKLEKSVNLTREIQVACLPKQPSISYPEVNQTAWIVGWGATSEGGNSSDILKNAKITIYDEKSYCSNYNISNWDKQICAGEYNGDIDTCQGDSGGPLYILDKVGNKTKYVTTGIVSYGVGCARNQTAGIYTRISAFLDWIDINR